MTIAKTNYKRQYKNANPPRRCRAVPAVLEKNAIETALALLDASGTRVKPSEAEFKVDFRGKEPKITLGSRFHGKWMKRVTFKVPTEQFDFQPYASV